MVEKSKKKRKSVDSAPIAEMPPTKRVRNKFMPGFVASTDRTSSAATPVKRSKKIDTKSPKTVVTVRKVAKKVSDADTSKTSTKRRVHRGKKSSSISSSTTAGAEKTRKSRKKRKMTTKTEEGGEKKVVKEKKSKKENEKENEPESGEKENEPESEPAKPPSKMEQLQSQLSSSRFRYINEQLYTSTSEAAVQMFGDDPEGYARQVEKWPKNPLDSVYSYLKAHSKPSDVIVDMGCGEAKLQEKLINRGYTNVTSFDLHALNDRVTVASMEKVPVEKATVDCVVFCLSLMGTNTADFVREASRILKTDGKMIIAEIRSRLPSIRKFTRALNSMGFECGKEQSLGGDMFFQLICTKSGKARKGHPKGLELTPCYYKKR